MKEKKKKKSDKEKISIVALEKNLAALNDKIKKLVKKNGFSKALKEKAQMEL